MKAIYSCCIIDPFFDVAKLLNDRLGIQPVYWIGDINSVVSNDEQELRKEYPNIPFQPYFEAWRGIFPKEIERAASTSYIDVDFLRSFSSQELQAISMMDRQDYDQHSFIFMERERYFLSLVKKWLACFELYKPDIVISAINPHRVFDYVLYLVCKYKNIKYVSFQYSMEIGRIFPLEDFANINSMAKLLDEDYHNFMDKGVDQSHLPTDILSNFNRLTADYAIARPQYMMTHDVDDVKNRNVYHLARRFMSKHHLFGKDSLLKIGQTRTIYKNSKYSLEHSRFSVLDWYLKRRQTLKYNSFLRDYYCARAFSTIDLKEKYIIFFLHYQPEETTAPNGDIFVNQLLCVETLLKNTPPYVNIYVKEHPNQFMSHMQGHTKRIKEFYDDLLLSSRVKLVPLEIDSFSLMTNAIAVSTVTGTVGWEAVVRKKPVIIFGVIWYERLNGVLRVVDDFTASKIYEFINTYKYDEGSIIAYLAAVAKHSILAYHYKGYKEITGYSHSDTVKNIFDSLSTLMSVTL